MHAVVTQAVARLELWGSFVTSSWIIINGLFKEIFYTNSYGNDDFGLILTKLRIDNYNILDFLYTQK